MTPLDPIPCGPSPGAEIAQTLKQRPPAPDGCCEICNRLPVGRGVGNRLCEFDVDEEREVCVLRFLCPKGLSIYANVVIVALLHDESLVVRTKSAHKVIEGLGANMELGVVIHLDDGFINDCRYLDPHPYIDRAVGELYLQCPGLLRKPVSSHSSRGREDILRTNSLSLDNNLTFSDSLDL